MSNESNNPPIRSQRGEDAPLPSEEEQASMRSRAGARIAEEHAAALAAQEETALREMQEEDLATNVEKEESIPPTQPPVDRQPLEADEG